jgi:hypothetical protein
VAFPSEFGQAGNMRKRGRMIFFAAIVVVGGFGLWALLRSPAGPPDLVYDGHPLSYWVRGSPPGTVYVGPRVLDSNAVPYLVWTLNKRSGVMWHAYLRIWPHLPGWLRSRLDSVDNARDQRFYACRLLGTLGSAARPAIPALVAVLQDDEDGGVRGSAAYALGRIANRDDKTVADALSNATTVKIATHPELNSVANMALRRLHWRPAENGGVTNAP